MASEKKATKKDETAQKAPERFRVPKLDSAKLLAALSYMTDISPEGSCYHSWRVALLAQRIAADVAPDIRRDVFYAGLVHDIGSVGAYMHITECSGPQSHLEDPQIRNHPRVGAAILDWLPSMDIVAGFVRSHHEWWDGSGYPERRSSRSIPMGSRIIAAADTADLGGCFDQRANVFERFRMLSPLVGHAWPAEVWSPLVRVTTDASFYRALMDARELPRLIVETIAELPCPDELLTGDGIERVLHIFGAAVDVKDPSTAGHSFRTARCAAALMRHMGRSEEEAQTAYRAGVVHDCGRVGLRTNVMNRAGRLNEDEMNLVRGHAQMTIRIMSCLPDSDDMAELGRIAGHDHERWDGTGYPDRLAGENIPLISRVMSVVDAFDSMICTTSYRMLSPKCAIIRLKKGSGTQFDPQVVDAMVSAMEENAVELPLRRAA